jgi:acyl-CoA thioesterase
MPTPSDGGLPSISFEFDADTAARPEGDGLFRVEVTDRWGALAGVNGGYTLAIAVNAMSQSIPLPDPLVVSGSFLRPAVAGVADIAVRTVRVGRRHATAEASLHQSDKEVLRTLATFADLGDTTGRVELFGDAPTLAPPDECLDPMTSLSMPGLTIAERVEFRVPELPGWVSGSPSGRPRSEFWMRFKDGRRPDTSSLVFLVDAAPPAVLEIGEMSSTTVELTAHVRARPADGWLACRHETRYLAGGYHEEDFEVWDSRGALVAQSRQLAMLP